MSLKGMIAQGLRMRTGQQFERDTWQPEAAQWKKLQQIVQRNANTAFGQAHRFAEIHSVQDYQRQVPIRDYAALKPWIDRMTEGEAQVLTHQKPFYYCRTSGTTGEPKITPVTEDYRNEYQSVVHAFLYYLYKEHPKAFDGQALYFHGMADYVTVADGTPAGSMSGFNSKNLPPLLKRFYAAPYDIMVIADPFTRHFCIALLALAKNITLIMAVTPSPPILLAETLKKHGEELLFHLEKGTLPKTVQLNAAELALMQTLHRPHPQRAQHLRRLLAQKGSLTPTQVWPALEVIGCWKTSSAGMLIPQLEAAYPDIPIRDAIFSASEGWCNVPYTDQHVGGPLAVNAHFYEFIAADDNSEHPEVVLAHELNVGQDYRIVLTTSCGMYRYDLGDILRVTHYYHQTPVVHFVRKAGQYSSMATEMLAVEHIFEVMAKLLKTHAWILPFYVLVPNPTTQPPHYELYLEGLNKTDAETLAEAFDEALQIHNFSYGLRRRDLELDPVKAHVLRPGAYQLWQAQKLTEPGNDAQIKPPGLLMSNESLRPLCEEPLHDAP